MFLWLSVRMCKNVDQIPTSPNESLRAVVQCAAAALCMISKTSFTFDSLCINNQKNAHTSSATNLFTCYKVTTTLWSSELCFNQ